MAGQQIHGIRDTIDSLLTRCEQTGPREGQRLQCFSEKEKKKEDNLQRTEYLFPLLISFCLCSLCCLRRLSFLCCRSEECCLFVLRRGKRSSHAEET